MSRIKLWVWVGALLIAGLVYSQTRVATDERAFLDELMASVLSPDSPPPLNLPLVPTNAVLESATYWSAQANEDSPPYPYNPVADLGLPVYSLGNNSFLFDDRAVNYVAWNQVQATMRQIASGGMTMNSLEFPGEGEGTNENGGWTNSYVPIVYGTNDLWLEITNVVDGAASLVIHTPDVAAYDLFSTTNLALDVPGLNGTNWVWLMRTDVGQTNITFTTIWPEIEFFRLGTMLDSDSDNLTDAFELLVSHSNPATNDTDGDDLFDGWEWKHFGSFSPTGGEDYDGDTVSNLAEQTADSDPNTIEFVARAGFGHVNSLNPLANFTVSHGVPAELAVLVDSTNFDNPTWQPYTTTPVVPLPDADGEHLVWVALRGRVNATSWQGFGVTLDRVAPALVISGPTNDTTFKSIIQVTGYSTDALWSVSCTLSNATGLQTNISALVTDTDFGASRTNHFQCFDVELTNGVNNLMVQVSDRAGNLSMTNLSITFDTTGDSNAPVLTLLWPQAGSKFAADVFTLRAQVDDETAGVRAIIVGPCGVTNEYDGMVERNGAVWVEEIALEAGTNILTLTAIDSATNSSSTNLTLIRGGVNLAITEPANLNTDFVTVTGTVSDSSYSVWVNGVQASVSGNDWTALNVPVPAGGSAVFAASAIPPGGNITGGGGSSGEPALWNPYDPNAQTASIQPEKPALVKLIHGEWERHEKNTGIDPFDLSLFHNDTDQTWSWDEKTGGYADITWTPWTEEFTAQSGMKYWLGPDGTERFERWVDTPANIISTNAENLEGLFGTDFNIQGPQAEGRWAYHTSGSYGSYSEDLSAKVDVRLRTGGRTGLRAKKLFSLSAAAQMKTLTGFSEIPPTNIWVQSFGQLGSDGLVYAELPDNKEVPVNLLASDGYFSFGIGATKHRLRIIANGYPLKPDRVATFAKFCVGQKIDLEARFVPEVPGLVTVNPRWSPGGKYVNYHYTGEAGCELYRIGNYWNIQNPTRAWYLDGGEGEGSVIRVGVGMFCRFANGREELPVAQGMINVHRPSVTLTMHKYGTPEFVWTQPWTGPFGGPAAIGVGVGPGTTNSMEFTAWVTSSFDGDAKWIQKLELWDSTGFFVLDGNSIEINGIILNALDNEDPFGPIFPIQKNYTPTLANNLNRIPLEDAPEAKSSGLVNVSTIAIQAQFTSYIMFQPEWPDSIWVTLGTAPWSISATATSPSTNISPNSVSGPTGLSPTSDLPEWQHVLGNPSD